MIPDRQTAQKLFEEFIAVRNASDYPFVGNQEQILSAHSCAVAESCAKVAPLCGLDIDKAWVAGLLHDCGRVCDEPREHRFHGLVGYHYMLERGYPELARYSLTHTFYEKDFDINEFPQNKNDLQVCKELLKDIEYDDYDRLIQLMDLCNDLGQICTLEYRFESISRRYNMPLASFSNVISSAHHLKAYFDKKCGQDIYKVLGLQDE